MSPFSLFSGMDRRAFLKAGAVVTTCLSFTFITLSRALAADGQIETPTLKFSISGNTGHCEITDKAAGVTWKGSANSSFGRSVLLVDGKQLEVQLTKCSLESDPNRILATFHPSPEKPELALRVRIEVMSDR